MMDNPLSPAQESKARRFVAAGLIKPVSRFNTMPVAWAVPKPYRAVVKYEVKPLPNCHDTLMVEVVEHYEADDSLAAVTVTCSCQRGKLGAVCSHVEAVRIYRTAGRR